MTVNNMSGFGSYQKNRNVFIVSDRDSKYSLLGLTSLEEGQHLAEEQKTFFSWKDLLEKEVHLFTIVSVMRVSI
jgi:hypothetical protein